MRNLDTEGTEKSFIKTLDEACSKFSWELFAYCLIGDSAIRVST